MPKKPGVFYGKNTVRNASYGAGQGPTQAPINKDANQIATPNKSGRFMKRGKNVHPSMKR